MKHALSSALLCLALWPSAWGQAASTSSTVYRCPGPPVLYTDGITAQEAKDRHCRVIEGAPVTVVSSPRPAQRPRESAPVASGPRGAETRVEAGAQRQRDSDARRILESELKREETRLAELQKEYNNGDVERLGDERNYQRHLDRVAEMRSAIARKESDIAAIKRELAKLPQ
jgi:predicted lipid-binding transport protein (Tim44 family)